jgi:hypothetical protein
MLNDRLVFRRPNPLAKLLDQLPPRRPLKPVRPSLQLAAVPVVHKKADTVLDLPDIYAWRNLMSTAPLLSKPVFSIGIGADCYAWTNGVISSTPLPQEADHVTCTDLNPAGTHVAIGAPRGKLFVADIERSAIMHSAAPGGDDALQSTRLIKWDGPYRCAVAAHGHVRVRDLRDGARVAADLQFPGAPVSCDLHPDNYRVVTATAESSCVRLWDLRKPTTPFLVISARAPKRKRQKQARSNTDTDTDPEAAGVTCFAAFHPRCEHVFYVHGPCGLERWSTSGDRIQTVPVPGISDNRPWTWGAMAIDPAGERCAVAYGSRVRVLGLRPAQGGAIVPVPTDHVDTAEATVLSVAFAGPMDRCAGPASTLVATAENEMLLLQNLGPARQWSKARHRLLHRDRDERADAERRRAAGARSRWNQCLQLR